MIAELSECPWWLIAVLISVPAVVMFLAARGVTGWLDAREERAMNQRLRELRVKNQLTSFTPQR